MTTSTSEPGFRFAIAVEPDIHIISEYARKHGFSLFVFPAHEPFVHDVVLAAARCQGVDDDIVPPVDYVAFLLLQDRRLESSVDTVFRQEALGKSGEFRPQDEFFISSCQHGSVKPADEPLPD